MHARRTSLFFNSQPPPASSPSPVHFSQQDLNHLIDLLVSKGTKLSHRFGKRRGELETFKNKHMK